MARRKRKEEDVLWSPPEFDEVGYMRQEIQNAKIAVVVIAWAVVGAIVAYLLAQLNPVLGYLAGLAAFGALYYLLPILGLPIHGFKRRDWMSHASVYFFSWLAFSILLLNPPFGDHTNPVVGPFQIGTFNTSNVTAPAADSVYCIPAPTGAATHLPGEGQNKTLYILFRATDNVRVASVNVTVGSASVDPSDVSGQASACMSSATPNNNLANTYAVMVTFNPVSLTISVTAVDVAGLRTAESINVLP